MKTSEENLPRLWIKPYYGGFNGLRGIAVLLTFFSHYLVFWHAEKMASFMWAGVDLFFVLSGFLITGILYDTVQTPHFFRTFYIRRALRIFPLFYGFFILLFASGPILRLHYPLTILSFVFYVGNLAVPFMDLVRHNPTVIWISRSGTLKPALNIGHLWSLCVEEQFYLMWPAVVWFVRDRRRLMRICTVLIAATLLGRVFLVFYAPKQELHQYLIFWSTYTRCDTILVGAWLALWLRGKRLSVVALRRVGILLFTLPTLVLVTCLSLLPTIPDAFTAETTPFVETFGFSLIALAAAGILVLSLDDAGVLSRALRFRLLSSLGVVSYGFYFLHALPEAFFLWYAHRHPRQAPWLPPLAFALTLLLATLSFRFYETPFLKLKSRFAKGHNSVPSGREQIDFV